MRQLFLAIVLSLCASTAFAADKPVNHTKHVQNAVRPVQIKHEGELVAVCTSWAVRINMIQYFVSAGHCALDEKMFIDGQPAMIVKVDKELDLVLFSGGPRVDSLNVSFSEPAYRQRIFSVGYPYHAKKQFAASGDIANPLDEGGRELYTMPSGSGMSGSPVVDERTGFVIGLLQEVPNGCGSFCPVSRGATVAMLRRFLFGE